MSAVLVDACKEHGIETSAAANYALQYKRTTVDLSQPFRLTGIPQNTTLDLKEVGSASGSSTVRLGVKLPSGDAHITLLIASHIVDIYCVCSLHLEFETIKGFHRFLELAASCLLLL
jgi:TUG ubiquitin-like domain